MHISVVVPTYRRPQSLACCLDALDRQTRLADETIVVVRGDDAAGQEVVRARSRAVRLVLVQRPGVVAAMNAGLEASSGDVIALTDDDSAPHADWLARIAAMFASDSRIAAVGGRDWVYSYRTGRLIEGSEPVVGTIGWFGRVTGNHHVGVGQARDVDVLKGVNLSVRGELLRQVRFDERLRGVGTEHHWELALCLELRRRGWRIVYDPAIAVDHYIQPRVDDSRQFDSLELRDSTHNETVAVLEYLSPLQGRASPPLGRRDRHELVSRRGAHGPLAASARHRRLVAFLWRAGGPHRRPAHISVLAPRTARWWRAGGRGRGARGPSGRGIRGHGLSRSRAW